MENIYDSLEARLANTYSIRDENAYNKIVNIQDYHGNLGLFKDSVEALGREAGSRDIYVQLGDVTDGKKSLEMGTSMGLKDSNSIEMEIYAANMSEEDRDLFSYVKTIESFGGIDRYLDMASKQYPGMDLKPEKKRFEANLAKYKSSGIEDFIAKFKAEHGDEIEMMKALNQDTWRLIDKKVSESYMDDLADYINEYNANAQREGRGKINLVVGGDNHTKTSSIEYLKSLVKVGDVHNINDVSGAIVLGEGEDAFRYQHAGNVTNVFQHVDNFMGMSQEEMMYEYPHMFNATFMENVPVEYKDRIDLKVALNSYDLYRITKGGKEFGELDHLSLHMEPEYDIGAIGFEGKPSPYGRFDDLGVLWMISNMLKRDKEGYVSVTSGHIHSGGSTRNLEMMIDKARGDSFIIGKSGRKAVGAGGSYDVKEFDLETFMKSIEGEYMKLLESYGLAPSMQDGAADDYYSSSSKAA